MKNINRIESFLPESRLSGKHISELLPQDVMINEAVGDGINLDGKTFGEVKVSEWMFDFGIERKSFPRGSIFTEWVVPDENLSVFAANIVNTFAVQAWKAIKTKKIFSAAITEKERLKIKSKLRGFFGTKKKLDIYNQEKESLVEFLQQFETFLFEGRLGEAIQMDADDMLLSKSADPASGPVSKIFTTLKSFFTRSGWQKALGWIIANIANNDQYVKWLDKTVYEPNTIASGINPDVMSAFNAFIVETNIQADLPNMDSAMPSIKRAVKSVIEKSKDIPKQGAETWMGALYNTYLFGLYQKMLIIGCCAWVYDQIGDTNIMTQGERIRTPRSEESPSGSAPAGLEVSEHNGVNVYKISYISPEFKKILDALLRDGQIGETKYESYMNRIESKKDSKSVIRSVRIDLVGWGNTHSFSRTDTPEAKGLATDGSTRVIIPIEMYKKLVK
jgi:hypothetical protein